MGSKGNALLPVFVPATGGRYDEKNGLFVPCADAFLRFL